MDTMHDRIAVQAALEGKVEAYRALVDRYHLDVIHYIYGLIGDEEAAHDIAQEVSVRAFQQLRQYSAKHSFAAWLHRLARKLALQDMKYHAAWAQSADPADEDGGPRNNQFNRQVVSEHVRLAMSRLRPEWRSVIQLYYWDDKTHEEIAELLDVPVSSVRTWLHRAETLLKKQTYQKDSSLSMQLTRARPLLSIDSAFTAKVMAEVRTSNVKFFIPWRQLVMAASVVCVVVGVGAGAIVFVKLQAGTTGSNSVSDSAKGSSTNSGQKSGTTTGPDYRALTANAQSDIDAMSLQTGKFSDADYADSQLADSQIY